MYWLLKKCKSPCWFQCVLAYSFWALLFAWSRFKQSSYSCIWCQRVRELSHGFNETLQNITKDVTNWNIDVHCTLVWMLPRNNKNEKNSLPKETKFCCFKFTSYSVFIFRQAQFSIILSCKWMYCMYDFFLVIIYCRFGCGNNVHVKCMKVWAEHQRSTGENIIKCPLCRVDFGSFQVCKPGKRIICSINDLQLNDFPASYFQQWDVCKTMDL